MRTTCSFYNEVEIRIPSKDERTWHCSKGYICLYDSFFMFCKLWFPLPRLFVKYFENCRLAFTQLMHSKICHMVSLLTLGAECGIKLTVELFEELSAINRGSFQGRFNVSMRPKRKIITDFKDKIYNWDAFYFFVKINEASVLDVGAHYRTRCNLAFGRYPG